MTRGDTRTITETIGPTGLPAGGIAGWSFWFTAKVSADDPDSAAVVQKLPAAWAIQTVGSSSIAGVVLCTLNPSDTANLPPYQVNLVYDVQAKDTNGNIFTLDNGILTVVTDVTIATS